MSELTVPLLSGYNNASTRLSFDPNEQHVTKRSLSQAVEIIDDLRSLCLEDCCLIDDISINEQTFEDYKSKYLDLRDKVKRENAKEKVSILNDIDFELELIHRDEINVAYILKLLANLKNSVSGDEQEKQLKNIMDIVAGDTQLRSKRELIEKFINEHLPIIEDSEDIPDEFVQFMTTEKLQAIKSLSKEEGLDSDKLEKVIGDYMFTEKIPLRDDIIGTMKTRPSLKERKTKAERITNKILEFVETFISGIMTE